MFKNIKYLGRINSVNLITQGNKALSMIPEINFEGVKHELFKEK